MKRQTLDQLRHKSKAELRQDIAEAQKELVALRLKKGQQVMANVREIGQLKRKVAVLQTFARNQDK